VAENGSAGNVGTRAAGWDCAVVDEDRAAVTDETPQNSTPKQPHL